MTPDRSIDLSAQDTPGVRAWEPGDDAGLLRILEVQAQADPGWPPDYARDGDLLAWLGAPASLGRWVAHVQDRPVGHVGLAPVHAGPMNDLWRAALPPEAGALAEVCRLVVDPGSRRGGVSVLLTRKAVRAAIESGFMPVANALADRNVSLAMMIAAGWRTVGSTRLGFSGRELVALAPPQKLIDAAIARQS